MAIDHAYDTLKLQVLDGQVLQVTLDRPQAGNAINTRMGQELLALWRGLTEDAQGVRCVVLTGAGGKIFCAGGDLKERNGMTRAQWTHQHEIFERVTFAMTDLPLPLIAAVNGHAFGGGLEMALCCDFIHAHRAARFGLPEVTLGIMPGMGGTQNLSRALGERRARELLLTGRPFTAQEAFEWGLVNQLAEGEAMLAGALDTARTIARNAPLSVRQIKRSVRYGMQMDIHSAYRFEIEAYNQLVDTEDRREGVAAFNEKRPPVFRGH
jgi:enoyl-CoA hydratase